MAQFKLLTRNEFSSTEAGRVGKTDVSYNYMNLETFATYQFTIHSEEDSPERVKAVLQEKVAHAAAAGPGIIEIA